MSFLIANVPPIRVYVKKEYLYDHQKGHGEYAEGHWVTVKSIQGRALYFETYIYESGALFDKLPISAFVSRTTDLGEDMKLEDLELWDAFSYNIAVLEKITAGTGKVKYYSSNRNWYYGKYLFTIDSGNPDKNITITDFSEVPEQHKSFNILELDNGHFAAQPNNRMLILDKSYTPKKLKFPDFKVSSREYTVEDKVKETFGDEEEFMYGVDKYDENNRDTRFDPFKGTSIEGKD